jgi:hypothetical protein
MSNQATLQPTVFVNHPGKEKSFGFRIYDSYGMSYNNLMVKEDLSLPPLEFLNKARECFDDSAKEIYENAIMHGGIFVGDDWLESCNGEFVSDE